ncbi:collagen alpha-1(XI) chain-like [Scleropages formosus]|uniref:collagen alpha-1(XI) chain-like n=1 Tax=Scleropages formosus TaxID=113540 RepID=UPI0008788D02|nr:collagen alpha-1(XI) chain-like [Scleropages formosus]
MAVDSCNSTNQLRVSRQFGSFKLLTNTACCDFRCLYFFERNRVMLVCAALLFPVVALAAAARGALVRRLDAAEGSGTALPEKIDLLEFFSWQAANSDTVSLSTGPDECMNLHIGHYATLALPTYQAFGTSFADEFSVLMQLRSSQQEDRSLLTVLSPQGHILLQVRLSPRALNFITTQQRLYEFPVVFLSDGEWHHVSLAVSVLSLALYVDCMLVESVDWTYLDLDIITDSLLMVGGIIEDFETPFEGDLRQLTFVMGDPNAAKDHCRLHLPVCRRSVKTP